MLDETFRQRVANLAAHEESTLDGATYDRIIARTASEGPGLVKAAARKRRAVLALGPALAAAAGFVLWAHHRAPARETVERGVALRSQGGAVVAGARPCESRPIPSTRSFTEKSRGPELDLGQLAFAVAEPGSEVKVETVSTCSTVLGIASGTVLVHAKDLGGGELRVVGRDGDVLVHGTMFAVTQSADSFVVEVAEGRVTVHDRTGEHWVGTGERLYLSPVGLGQGPLPAERVKEIRERLGAPAVVGLDALRPAEAQEAPGARRGPGAGAAPPAGAQALAVDLAEAPTATDLLAEAERARKAGQFELAREKYSSVAGGRGPSAEAAWLGLARMELSLGRPAAALAATKKRQERFGQGTLSPEALWIDVRAYRQSGQTDRARELAEELVGKWGSSPQGRAAQRWLLTGE